jgi:hypothetical protein
MACASTVDLHNLSDCHIANERVAFEGIIRILDGAEVGTAVVDSGQELEKVYSTIYL